MTITTRSFLLISILCLSFCLLSIANAKLDLCVKRCHEDEDGLLECTTRCQRQDLEPTNREDPRRLYYLCQKRCDRQEREPTLLSLCKKACEREFERAKREAGGEHNPERREEEEEEKEGRSGNNPYRFSLKSFRFRFRSSEGSLRVLPRFTERSRWLFEGIENYRFAFLEAEPNTFVMPHHSDADAVFIVVRGKGTVSFVSQKTKESFHIEQGHAVRVPAGTTVYVTNTDNNQRLGLAKMFVPVNTPGRFEDYFVAGAQNQQSYFHGFSTEVLEASLNVSRELLDKVLRQQEGQGQGIVRRASQEQIKELSQQAASPRGQKQQGPRWTPFNLTGQKPTYSNEFGQFYEVEPDDCKQLEDLDISVSLTNMTEDSIFVPHYNSRATILVFVKKGNGSVEIACPHISSQQWQEHRSEEKREWKEGEGEEQKGQIRKIRFPVSEGELFIIPTGHPVALVSSNTNFQTVGFGINARNNQRNFLAGQDNIIKQVEREAKQLAFGAGRERVERVFQSQDESYFVPARRSQRRSEQKEGSHPFQSIFEAVAI